MVIFLAYMAIYQLELNGHHFEDNIFKLFFKKFVEFNKALTDDKSTLIQDMYWYYQASSHYMDQCAPRPTALSNVSKPQRV